jgi:hypothetical protein
MLAVQPQQDPEPEPTAAAEPEPEGLAAKNPFPTRMAVPGPDGEDVTIELAVAGGVLYAPLLEELPLDPYVKQYVTQYCAAWSSSVVTTGRLTAQWQTPPRRGQLVFRESSLHAMLGLAGDERLCRIDVDQLKGEVRFVVESPRLPPMPFWDGGPPVITLPIAGHYEQQAPA